MPPTERIDGKLTRLTYVSEDGEFLIGRLKPADGIEVPILGPAPLTEGVSYRLHGEWVTHAEHGRQFRFSLATPLTHDRRGITEYLKLHAPHVGEQKAARLWALYGADAVDTLRHQPEQVVAAGILTEAQAAEAAQALHNAGAWQQTRIDLTGLLAGRGFQLDPVISEAIQRWRRNAPEVVRRNPYALLLARPRIPSCGWSRVDKLYCDLGHARDTLKRQALTLTHGLLARSGGDTWVPARDAASDLERKIAGADFVAAARLAERARLVVIRRHRDGRWLAPWQWASDEQAIADALRRRQAWTPNAQGPGRKLSPLTLTGDLLITPS